MQLNIQWAGFEKPSPALGEPASGLKRSLQLQGLLMLDRMIELEEDDVQVRAAHRAEQAGHPSEQPRRRSRAGRQLDNTGTPSNVHGARPASRGRRKTRRTADV